MKVRCVDDSHYDGRLTVNKVYEVIERHGYWFVVLNDVEQEDHFRIERFEIVEEGNKMVEGVSTWEMIRLLFENPDRKAIDEGFEVFFCPIPERLKIKNLQGFDNDMFLVLKEKNSKWTIIEPKKELKKMSFIEVFKHYRKGKLITSLVTKESYISGYAQILDKEIDGFWTCEGVYEDEL